MVKPSYRVILIKHMAPLIVYKEQEGEGDDDEAGDDEYHHHHATVHQAVPPVVPHECSTIKCYYTTSRGSTQQ